MFTAQGPKCCVLEGSPRYRGGTVVQFAQIRLVYLVIISIGCNIGSYQVKGQTTIVWKNLVFLR